MTLIDTSAWVEFFRSKGDARVKQHVSECLLQDAAAFTCPVLFELLAGVRNPTEEALIRDALGLCERLEFVPEYWEEAARLERTLRAKGVTVPRDDILVATVAGVRQMPILCKDAHFDLIRKAGNHELRVCQAV